MCVFHRGVAFLQRVRRDVRSFGDAWRVARWTAWRALWVPALAAINKRHAAWWFLRRRSRFALAGWRRRLAPTPSLRRRQRISTDEVRIFDFDLRTYNPIHWRPATREEAPALGRFCTEPPGATAEVAARRLDPVRLRRHHHVVDVRAFHRDPATRAGTLARLAAAGVVVHIVDADARLQALMGPELCKLTTVDPKGFDAGQRELHSIRMRREAMRRQWARRSQQPPAVSILLATRRPAVLPQALAAVARQTYPRLELALALHGHEGAFAEVEEQVAALPFPATAIRAPRSASLGQVLNEAVEAAGGTLLTKMDDDDLYGPEHVWDLVLAREYSGAQVVAKASEFDYLAAPDRTVRRASGTGESYRTDLLAGGTLLIAADDLERIGGWRNVPRAEDVQLVRDVLRAGGGVYRTHGTGFIRVRHGVGHTWQADDGHFLLTAERIVPGCALAAAGIDPVSQPAAVGR